MPWWVWLIDAIVVLLLLFLIGLIGLILRRRLVARNGGTFELSYRPAGDASARGWILGVGRYSGEDLEWFRLFSLRPSPSVVWSRERLAYDGKRAPDEAEQPSLFPDHVVITCTTPEGLVELAMSPSSLTGLQSWLEAQPPGTDWSRA